MKSNKYLCGPFRLLYYGQNINSGTMLTNFKFRSDVWDFYASANGGG